MGKNCALFQFWVYGIADPTREADQCCEADPCSKADPHCEVDQCCKADPFCEADPCCEVGTPKGKL